MPATPFAAPLVVYKTEVQAEWLESYNQSSTGYYGIVFDRSIGLLMNNLDLGRDYRRRTDRGFLLIGSVFNYFRDVAEGQPAEVRAQYLGHDEEIFRFVLTLVMGSDHKLVAFSENLLRHVTLRDRRVAKMTPDALITLEKLRLSHADLPPPDLQGHGMGFG